MEPNKISVDGFLGKGGIVVCSAGSADLVINSQPYHITPGDAWVVTPLLLLNTIETSADFEALQLLAPVDVLLPNIRLIFNTAIPIIVLQRPIFRLSDADFEMARMRIRHIEQLQHEARMLPMGHPVQKILHTAGSMLLPPTVMELVAHFLLQYMQAHPEGADINPRYVDVVLRFVRHMIMDEKIDRSVATYAADAHLSVGHFSAIVRSQLRQSPQTWITFFIINRAKALLHRGDKNIKEIAQELGFPEQFTFRKYFKLHAGVSPTAYMNQSR